MFLHPRVVVGEPLKVSEQATQTRPTVISSPVPPQLVQLPSGGLSHLDQ
jgi:hypothetical protein